MADVFEMVSAESAGGYENRICGKDREKDAFTAQFDNPDIVELAFENEKFAVYISDKNLMKMQ